MADLAQTITNSFTLLGASPVNVWGTMEWGTDNWGISKDLPLIFLKVLSESLAPGDSVSLSFIKVFGNITAIDADTPSIELFSGDYNYVFPGDKSNVVSQIVSDYTIRLHSSQCKRYLIHRTGY